MVSTIGIHESVGNLFPPAVLRDRLADIGPEVLTLEKVPLRDCDAVVTFDPDERFTNTNADLSWVHVVLAGVDDFPLADYEEAGVTLTNSTGVHGDAVGETVVGYMTAFARRLHVHRRNEPERTWAYPDWDEAFTLRGESLCLVGLGTLGRGIATRADSLGMDVVGVRRTPTPVEGVDRVYPPRRLDVPLAEARFVALAVPLTDRTRGLLGRPELDTMREDAVLMNVARGEVADESALVGALRTGDIAGAALDVFEDEPLPDSSPLWEMENVIVTPHAAAATVDYVDRVGELVRESVRLLEAGESPVNRVI